MEMASLQRAFLNSSQLAFEAYIQLSWTSEDFAASIYRVSTGKANSTPQTTRILLKLLCTLAGMIVEIICAYLSQPAFSLLATADTEL